MVWYGWWRPHIILISVNDLLQKRKSVPSNNRARPSEEVGRKRSRDAALTPPSSGMHGVEINDDNDGPRT
ncbi:hypothetical protein OIU85_020372 [Salix viminalis]|uniref:Uncharacterized protein n=1 Tax=Salix viminalis TaxID=40686 RepID=A0A9Q0ZCM7_SALVM|nr:hypothetical protein OIU85_020372 [Salix viminalis]